MPITLIGEFMPIIKQLIEPEVCTYIDPETNIITIEVILPKVEKNKIHIKVKNDAILIRAEGDDVDYSKYIYLSVRLKREMARAIYENDILRISVPLQD